MERRSLLHSAFRTSIAVGALALALASGMDAAANHWRMRKPEAALRFRVDDAVALTLRTDQQQTGEAIDASRAPAMVLIARTALMAEPLTAPALRQLAVAAGVGGRLELSRRLLDLAHQVSRHDLGTSLVLVEDSLNRGDIGLLLRSFDEASATSRLGQELMYPALAEGLFDPGVRAGLIPYLRGQRPWMPSFLTFAAASSPENATYATAMVLSAGGLPRTPAYAGIDSQLLAAAAAKGDFALARAYLQNGLVGGNAVLSDIRFTQATTGDGFGPFGWKLTDGEIGGARLEGAADLRIRISADQRTEVARRTLLLRPGDYRLNQRLSATSGNGPASLHWTMACLPGPREDALWSRDIRARSGIFREVTTISVPGDCPAQELILIAAADADQGNAELTVTELRLERR